ncbi:MAG: DUF1009 domain-containing protein [Candidatus Omnitrophota bacterium]|nr:MAG: DUF1009 domain-containing protein [Candidatus Omnitrophota bacterium]
MSGKIGLIAGNGKFPLLFAQATKKLGNYVVAVAIEEETEKQLENLVDEIHWISVGNLVDLLGILKQAQVKKVVMAGQIRHELLFSGVKLDKDLQNLFSNLPDRRTDTILRSFAQKIEESGIKLLDSTTFIKEYLPKKGVLSKTNPSKGQIEDIEFGFSIAKTIAGVDIGQTVVVKNKVVLAVETIEGTDAAIDRGSLYCQYSGAVVIKVSKPNQDMRFDIPVIGANTIEVLIRNKISVLAIEAKKTLFMDKEFVLSKADKHNIAIVAV